MIQVLYNTFLNLTHTGTNSITSVAKKLHIGIVIVHTILKVQYVKIRAHKTDLEEKHDHYSVDINVLGEG